MSGWLVVIQWSSSAEAVSMSVLTARDEPPVACYAVLCCWFCFCCCLAGGVVVGVVGCGCAKVEKSSRRMSFYKRSREKWLPGGVRLHWPVQELCCSCLSVSTRVKSEVRPGSFESLRPVLVSPRLWKFCTAVKVMKGIWISVVQVPPSIWL
jgi:hypothetical protein